MCIQSLLVGWWFGESAFMRACIHVFTSSCTCKEPTWFGQILDFTYISGERALCLADIRGASHGTDKPSFSATGAVTVTSGWPGLLLRNFQLHLSVISHGKSPCTTVVFNYIHRWNVHLQLCCWISFTMKSKQSCIESTWEKPWFKHIQMMKRINLIETSSFREANSTQLHAEKIT